MDCPTSGAPGDAPMRRIKWVPLRVGALKSSITTRRGLTAAPISAGMQRHEVGASSLWITWDAAAGARHIDARPQERRSADGSAQSQSLRDFARQFVEDPRSSGKRPTLCLEKINSLPSAKTSNWPRPPGSFEPQDRCF